MRSNWAVVHVHAQNSTLNIVMFHIDLLAGEDGFSILHSFHKDKTLEFVEKTFLRNLDEEQRSVFYMKDRQTDHVTAPRQEACVGHAIGVVYERSWEHFVTRHVIICKGYESNSTL